MPRRPSRARGWRNWRWAPGRPRRRGSAIQLHRRRLRRRPCASATTLARAARRSRAGFSASGLRGPASERPPRGSLPPKGHIPPEALLDWATPVPRPRHVPSRLRRKLLLQPAPLRHLLPDLTPVLEHVPRRIIVDGLEKFCLPHTTELCGGLAGECQKLLPDMPNAPRSQQKGFALCGLQQAQVLRESHLDLTEQGNPARTRTLFEGVQVLQAAELLSFATKPRLLHLSPHRTRHPEAPDPTSTQAPQPMGKITHKPGEGPWPEPTSPKSRQAALCLR
jgi:hypothetical protein